MIVVNYWKIKDEEGYDLTLSAVVNDTLSLNEDTDLFQIKECIDNCYTDFKEETLYLIFLQRAKIQSDPIDEPAFHIRDCIECDYDPSTGHSEPVIQL